MAREKNGYTSHSYHLPYVNNVQVDGGDEDELALLFVEDLGINATWGRLHRTTDLPLLARRRRKDMDQYSIATAYF